MMIKDYRAQLHYYMLISTPASMWDKYDALNVIGKTIFDELRDCSKEYDVGIKITLIEFDSLCRISHNAEDISDFQWTIIRDGQGVFLGDAYRCMHDLLDAHHIIVNSNGIPWYSPVFIFLGHSNPMDEYQEKLNQLKKNKWFIKGLKIAIRIGDYDWIDNVLTEFTNDKMGLFIAHNAKDLYKIGKAVIVESFLSTVKGLPSSLSLNEYRLLSIYQRLNNIQVDENLPLSFYGDNWIIDYKTYK